MEFNEARISSLSLHFQDQPLKKYVKHLGMLMNPDGMLDLSYVHKSLLSTFKRCSYAKFRL